MPKKDRSIRTSSSTVTLRTVAEHVGLAPCSVSAILNDSAAGLSIPQHTKERVRRAASLLNYRPNYSARALRTRRSYMVAVLTRDIGDAATGSAIAGAEALFAENSYCVLVTTCQWSRDWIESHLAPLRQRGVEGVIVIGQRLSLPAGFPHVFVDLERTDRLRDEGRMAAQSLLIQIEQRKVTREEMQLPDLRGESLNPLRVS